MRERRGGRSAGVIDYRGREQGGGEARRGKEHATALEPTGSLAAPGLSGTSCAAAVLGRFQYGPDVFSPLELRAAGLVGGATPVQSE